MAQLHELLAVEKTRTAAWTTLAEETLKKLGKIHMFQGTLRTLKMLTDDPTSRAMEAAGRKSDEMQTTVYDTLKYALATFATSEDLQASKNATNAIARGTVMWNGQELLKDLPIDELLGLEARLVKIRQIIMAVPTLDASIAWDKDPNAGPWAWRSRTPVEVSKTDKVMTPVIMAPATDKHPAQVQAVNKDVVIGTFTDLKFSGELTAVQKASLILTVDNLAVEIKAARMRANTATVVQLPVGSKIVDLLMDAISNPQV